MVANPEVWPPLDPEIEARICEMMARMKFEQKVGQANPGDSVTSAAPMFVASCASVVAPIIGIVRKGRLRQKAIAIWQGSNPCRAAMPR